MIEAEHAQTATVKALARRVGDVTITQQEIREASGNELYGLRQSDGSVRLVTLPRGFEPYLVPPVPEA